MCIGFMQKLVLYEGYVNLVSFVYSWTYPLGERRQPNCCAYSAARTSGASGSD